MYSPKWLPYALVHHFTHQHVYILRLKSFTYLNLHAWESSTSFPRCTCCCDSCLKHWGLVSKSNSYFTAWNNMAGCNNKCLVDCTENLQRIDKESRGSRHFGGFSQSFDICSWVLRHECSREMMRKAHMFVSSSLQWWKTNFWFLVL